MLLVHGLTSSGASWAPITERLADAFTCVTVDLPGHGSSPAGGDLGILALVAAVRSVVEGLGLERPAIVGHSLGAGVAAVYAAAHGARRVVLVDQSLRFGDFARLAQRHGDALRGPRTTEALWEIEMELGLGPYAEVDAMRERVLAFSREVVLGIWDVPLSTPPDELTARAEGFLPRIDAPLLALHGSPPADGYVGWLTWLVPTAAVEVWDGTGHLLHLVDPDRFAARVRAFLAT